VKSSKDKAAWRSPAKQSRVAQCCLWPYTETAAACTYSSRCRQLFPSGGSHLHISWAATTQRPIFLRQSGSITGQPPASHLLLRSRLCSARKMPARGRPSDERCFPKRNRSVQASSSPPCHAVGPVASSCDATRARPGGSGGRGEPRRISRRRRFICGTSDA
jgi:hypothetical protein